MPSHRNRRYAKIARHNKTMNIAQRIKKQGFHRWYERQLIEAHASLVTAFLCVILVAVCVDQLRSREGSLNMVIMLALAAAGVLLCIKTVSVYFHMLFRAEHIAQQANCAQCGAYGALAVTTASNEQEMQETAETPETQGKAWLRVRCRKCEHEWTMHESQP